jgi:ATP adenylyltransferase
MSRLWAPWRKAYIRPKGRKSKGCLFCRFLADRKKDGQNYLIKRNPLSFALLNLYPYSNGHVLILPNRHVDTLEKLTPREKLDWLGLCDSVTAVLRKKLKARGFNVGINLGAAAGAGIPKHLHLHIVPRWPGDVNFMPVLAGTKVISESLDSLYDLLTRSLNKK